MSATVLPIHGDSQHLPSNTQAADFRALLEHYNIPGPRYTSYPSIDHCSESVGEVQFSDALAGRRLGGLRRPLSLYVHVPFCESVCYYCACNKVVTKKRDRVNQYLNCLEREAMLIARQAAGKLNSVTQFHLGGGTPTFLDDVELQGLVSGLKMVFPFAQQAEMSIEVDPRTVDERRLLSLKSIGFNRLSFGVQDFDPQVQKAVHREQSFESVQGLIKASRKLGFDSINVDLIYGLPKQTTARFEETLKKLVALSPDRVALYGYAHLPDRFKPQRRIHSADLPDAAERVALLALAINTLQAAGYDYIGMDHFAKPTDALATAKRQGRLHRNFQGYTTQPEADLIGLGVSAISKVGNLMTQNTRDLNTYEDALQRGHLAVFRGHASNRDDLIRASAIMALLCQGQIDFEDFSHAHWIDFSTYFEKELLELQPFIAHGLLQSNESGVHVTKTGWFFVRPMAMVFDRYIQRSPIGRSKVL